MLAYITRFCPAAITAILALHLAIVLPGEDLRLQLRRQEKNGETSSRFAIVQQSAGWKASETAIIVCDFWDYHHCLNAVRRMKEFGPQLNRVLEVAREKGLTVIHSPSDCMPAYANHPARLRVGQLPRVDVPEDIQSWCSLLPGEEAAVYPIDQSDGGEDDDPAEHKAWAEELKRLGRNPNLPWKKQNDMISIDEGSDFISDQGDEVWRILKNKGIRNVILTGVHTNMCVLGRPFGIRQMKRNGVNVVLMRDMTDTMYNPQRWPYINHYAGTERVISHIEKYVCPTVSSDQIIGGTEFHFPSDPRPHLAMVIGESEYQTQWTLPEFGQSSLPDIRISYVFANPADRNDFPGLEVINNADALLVSIRRRVLPPNQMQLFRDFAASRKPILGIRTASHAFSLRNQSPPQGYVDWPEWDGEVFGGSYTNHHGNKLKSMVTYTEAASKHPMTVAAAIDDLNIPDPDTVLLKKFGQAGSLYKTSPLAKGASVLMVGSVLGHPAEPVSWTYPRAGGGVSFYTSMGHPLDFKNGEFNSLLGNAIRWSLNRGRRVTERRSGQSHWSKISTLSFPVEFKHRFQFQLDASDSLEKMSTQIAYRKVIRIRNRWVEQPLRLIVNAHNVQCWVNGEKAPADQVGGNTEFKIEKDRIDVGEANWIVIGQTVQSDGLSDSLKTATFSSGQQSLAVENGWQWRPVNGSFDEAIKVSLPAKFGGSTDVFQDLK